LKSFSSLKTWQYDILMIVISSFNHVNYNLHRQTLECNFTTRFLSTTVIMFDCIICYECMNTWDSTIKTWKTAINDVCWLIFFFLLMNCCSYIKTAKRSQLFMFNVFLSSRNILLIQKQCFLISTIIAISLIKIKNDSSSCDINVFNRNRSIYIRCYKEFHIINKYLNQWRQWC
jgi:glucose uptake protein GlcU